MSDPTPFRKLALPKRKEQPKPLNAIKPKIPEVKKEKKEKAIPQPVEQPIPQPIPQPIQAPKSKIEQEELNYLMGAAPIPTYKQSPVKPTPNAKLIENNESWSYLDKSVLVLVGFVGGMLLGMGNGEAGNAINNVSNTIERGSVLLRRT